MTRHVLLRLYVFVLPDEVVAVTVRDFVLSVVDVSVHPGVVVLSAQVSSLSQASNFLTFRRRTPYASR